MAQSEYEAGMQAIARRRAIADAMQAQALSPLSAPLSGTGSYPIQTRIQPLQIAAQLGQAWIAKKQNEKLDREKAEIAKAMSSDRAKALAALSIPQDMAPSYQVDPNADESQGPTKMIQQPQASGQPNFTAAQNAIDSGIDPQVVGAALKTQRPDNQPSSVQEYEYAKNHGFKGTFDQWIKMGGQTSRPSSVQEWDFFSKLPLEEQKRYLEMKRNPNFKVTDVMGAPTVVTGGIGGVAQAQPLSTTQQEIDAAARRKEAEGRAGAIGTGQGEFISAIQKKGANSNTINAVLDIADPLIDAATGSLVGAGADKLAGVFGSAPKGAQAIAQLQVLQAGLMLNQPRMEGPQSDRDVQLYREAAGQLGDPSVPRDIKKAAVQTIRKLQQRYQDRAASVTTPTPGAPKETAAQRAKRLGL